MRDLPPKAGSVDPEKDFDMRWQVQPSAHSRLADIAGSLTSAKALVLATDPDREGEAISWHLQQELQVRHGARHANSNLIVDDKDRPALPGTC